MIGRLLDDGLLGAVSQPDGDEGRTARARVSVKGGEEIGLSGI